MRNTQHEWLRVGAATAAAVAMYACGADSPDETPGTTAPPITPTTPPQGPDDQAAGQDAGAVAPVDASRPALMCVAAGTLCNPVPCCSGSVCVNDKVRGVDVCAGECLGDHDCVSKCCILVEGGLGHACAPANYCASSTPTTMTPVVVTPPAARITLPAGCGALRIVASDGTYLGLATGNEFAPDSVCNEFGTYGSEFQPNSIFNEFGTYGGEFQAMGAYNKFTSTPPALVCPGTNTIIGYVTKGLKSPSVDPDALCATLAASGL